MKIYTATLSLSTYHNKLDTYFNFDKGEEGYKVNPNFPDIEWVKSEGWLVDIIPMKMKVENIYGSYTVKQGFDHKLNKIELEQLESDMKKFLIEHLESRLEHTIQDYEEKINFLEGNED